VILAKQQGEMIAELQVRVCSLALSIRDLGIEFLMFPCVRDVPLRSRDPRPFRTSVLAMEYGVGNVQAGFASAARAIPAQDRRF
jgi:hypothetical protein